MPKSSSRPASRCEGTTARGAGLSCQIPAGDLPRFDVRRINGRDHEASRASVRALPFRHHYYRQEEAPGGVSQGSGAEGCDERPTDCDRMHRNVLVGGRHLALAAGTSTSELASWGEANDEWVRVAAEDLGAESRLERADGRRRRDSPRRSSARFVYTVSVTGIATPSIDARIVNRPRPAGRP